MMNTDPQYITRLLDLYYRGEATTAQENELKEFFVSCSPVPQGMEPDAAYFRSLAEENDVPPGVARRVSLAMAQIAVGQSRRRTIGRRIAAIAAGIAVLIGVGLSVFPARPRQTELTPEEAQQQVEMALTLLTSTIQKGYNTLNSL